MALSNPSIIDIAREAGVSKTTASLALRNDSKRPIKEETRLKVLEVAERYGYRPNLYASALRESSTHTIGILCFGQSQYISEKLMQIDQELYRKGYMSITRNIFGNPEYNKRAIDSFIASRVEGIIIMHPTTLPPNLLQPVFRSKIPVVSIDAIPDIPVDTISCDWRGGMRKIARYLLSMGHTRIFRLCGDLNNRGSAEKDAGFLEALTEAGIKPDPDLFIELHWLGFGHPPNDSMIKLVDDIADGRINCTAVACHGDEPAMELIRLLHDRKVYVPGDISVTGFDDLAFSAHMFPPLTTVAQPVKAQVELALDVLFKRISEGYDNSERQVYQIEYPIRIRESVRRVLVD